MSNVPEGACGEYSDYNGDATWIKELDLKRPDWPLAYVWSWTSRRWRSKRQKIRMDRVRLFNVN